MTPANRQNPSAGTGTIPKSNLPVQLDENAIIDANLDRIQVTLGPNSGNDLNVDASRTQNQDGMYSTFNSRILPSQYSIVPQNLTSRPNEENNEHYQEQLQNSRLSRNEVLNDNEEAEGGSMVLSNIRQINSSKNNHPLNERDALNYMIYEEMDPMLASQTYSPNPLVLSNKLSQLQNKLKSMRLVQHRLDSENVQPNLMEDNENKKIEERRMLEDRAGLTGPEKIELLNKLEELEAKKEKMSAMIQRVKSGQRPHTYRNMASENTTGPTIEVPTAITSQHVANRAKYCADDHGFGLRSETKSNIATNEELLAAISANDLNFSNNDQRMFSTSSPTLSLLDNLRALEVSRDSPEEIYNPSLEKDTFSTDRKNRTQCKTKTTKQRFQNVEISQASRSFLDTSLSQNQFSHIQNMNPIASRHQVQHGRLTPESYRTLQLNISNCNLERSLPSAKESSNQAEPFISKESNTQRSFDYTNQSSNRYAKTHNNILRQPINASESVQICGETTPYDSASAIRDQIKDLQDQIEFLYDEVSVASMAAECSMAEETLNVEQGSNKLSQIKVDDNLQNSSGSSYIMLNNSLGHQNNSRAHFVEERDTMSPMRSYINRGKIANHSFSQEKKLLLELRNYQSKVNEQQQHISHLNKALISHSARLSVVEKDMDGLHSVLRSLVDIIDNPPQQNQPNLRPSSTFLEPLTGRFTQQQPQTSNGTKSLINNLSIHQTQATNVYPSTSATSNTRRASAITQLESISQNEQSVRRTSVRNMPKSNTDYHLSSIGRKAAGNETKLATGTNIDLAKVSPRQSSNFQPILTDHQTKEITSSRINLPTIQRPSNYKNSVNIDSASEHLQQFYDNEPWRNFEIDMNNGLGNLNFGPFPSNNEVPPTIQERNLFNVASNQNISNDVGLGEFIAPFNSINNNEPNLSNLTQEFAPFSSTFGNGINQHVITPRDLLGLQSINEPRNSINHDADRVNQSRGPHVRPLESRNDEMKTNNELLPLRQRNNILQKRGTKAILPAPKSNANDVAASTALVNTLHLPTQSVITTSALNNQVPPGRRANNYWDNFKSYSRQNRLEVTPCTPQTTQSIPSRPTAAVGAVVTSGDQRIISTATSASPMVAQVPPRQQSVLSNNIAGPISQGIDFHIVGRESISDNPIHSDNQENIETERQASPRGRVRSSNVVQNIMFGNVEDQQVQPLTMIQSINHNSALVEPYLSNAHSPSRPRRKQKINREQNREMNSSNSTLEADNNIVQAAAMARAVANNSAALNQSSQSFTESSIKNSVNHYPSVFNSNNSRAINDLNFHSGGSPFEQYHPSRLGDVQTTTNTSAMVHPMSREFDYDENVQASVNVNENRDQLNIQNIYHLRDQAVPDISDASRITQSIFGHINNLITQTEANPELLQRLFDDIQTAGIPEFIHNSGDLVSQQHFINSTLQEGEMPQDTTENSSPHNAQMLGNYGDISADDEDEHVASSFASNQMLGREQAQVECTGIATNSSNTQTSFQHSHAHGRKDTSAPVENQQEERIIADYDTVEGAPINITLDSFELQNKHSDDLIEESSVNTGTKCTQSQGNESNNDTGAERLRSTLAASSLPQFDVAVPKNIQRNWNSRERGPGRCKLSTGKCLQLQHPVATVAGHSFELKSSNPVFVTPRAVKKEKPRSTTVLANDETQELQAVCWSSSKSDSVSENELSSNLNSSFNPSSSVKNQSHDRKLSYNPSLHSAIPSNGELPKMSEGHKNNNLSSNTPIGNVNQMKQAQKDEAHQAFVIPIQHDENVSSSKPFTTTHDSLQNISNRLLAGVSESSQCEMAEADQASICNSPEKNNAQNNPFVSLNDNTGTFQEVILTLPSHGRTQLNGSGSLKDSKESRKAKEDDKYKYVDKDNSHSCEEVDSNSTISDEREYHSLDLQTLQNSLLNANLERRQLQEESASALTVNAIVEEILNSPLNSGKNTPTESNFVTKDS